MSKILRNIFRNIFKFILTFLIILSFLSIFSISFGHDMSFTRMKIIRVMRTDKNLGRGPVRDYIRVKYYRPRSYEGRPKKIYIHGRYNTYLGILLNVDEGSKLLDGYGTKRDNWNGKRYNRRTSFIIKRHKKQGKYIRFIPLNNKRLQDLLRAVIKTDKRIKKNFNNRFPDKIKRLEYNVYQASCSDKRCGTGYIVFQFKKGKVHFDIKFPESFTGISGGNR